jgi:hypothetical protein
MNTTILPKLFFQLSPVEDASQIYNSLRAGDPFGIKENILNLGFPKHLLDKISPNEYSDEIDFAIINEFTLPFYKENQKKLEEQKSKLEKEWKKIEKIFLQTCEDLTKVKWKYPYYYFFLNPFLPKNQGFVPRDTDFTTIAVDNGNYVIAHELLMSHFWHVFHQVIDKPNQLEHDTYKHYWATNEIVTSLILLESNKLKKRIDNGSFMDELILQNYPKLYPLKKEVLEIFHKKQGKDLITSILELIKKKYPEENVQEFIDY